MNQQTYERMLEATTFFAILSSLLWLIVQVLMLVVIVKYGNPLEEDIKTLMVKKLLAA